MSGDAWGGSWGDAWGGAWGAVDSAAPPESPRAYAAGLLTGARTGHVPAIRRHTAQDDAIAVAIIQAIYASGFFEG